MVVHISSDLSWSNHVSNVCSRAKKQMGMLYYRFYCDCEPNILKTFFTSFVRPLLEYAVSVWDPHLVKDIATLESVQRFATKVCTKGWEDVDYDERLCMLNLPTLKARRHSLRLCFLYKLLNGLTIHTIVV